MTAGVLLICCVLTLAVIQVGLAYVADVSHASATPW